MMGPEKRTWRRGQAAGWVIGILSLVLFGNAAQAQSALSDTADQLQQQLAQALERERVQGAVIGYHLASDESIAKQDARLLEELDRLLVQRLSTCKGVKRVLRLKGTVNNYQDHAKQNGVDLLLKITVGLSANAIRLSADFSLSQGSFWDTLASPSPSGTWEHLLVSSKLDEEVRLLLGKPQVALQVGSWHLTPLLQVPGRIIDVGVGDVDGQEGVELVLLLENEIEVLSNKGGQWEPLAAYSLADRPQEKVRVRDEAGSLLVSDFNRDGRYEIFYKTFSRRPGEILIWNKSGLQAIRQLEQVPLCVYRKQRRAMVVYGTPDPGTNRYLPEISVADINASVGQRQVLPAGFSTFRCWQSQDDATPTFVMVDVHGGLFRLDNAWRPQLLLSAIGAGSGLMDIEGDGTGEVVVSDLVWPGESDTLRVMSGDAVVWRSRDFTGGVVAISSSEPTGSGRSSTILATVEAAGNNSQLYLLGP